MALKQTAELLSVDDYLEGELHSEHKYEYLGGVVHAMAGGTLRHGSVGGNCFLSLGNSLRGKPCRPFNSDILLKLTLPTHVRFYYPDLQIVCGPRDDSSRFNERPTVVIEVLSESTRRADLGEKRDAYLTIPELKVLLIIEPAQPLVRVDRRLENGGFIWETYQNLQDIISLPEVETTLPLSEIYEGINFD